MPEMNSSDLICCAYAVPQLGLQPGEEWAEQLLVQVDLVQVDLVVSAGYKDATWNGLILWLRLY